METTKSRDLLIREIKNLHRCLISKRSACIDIHCQDELALFDDLLVLAPTETLQSLRSSLAFLCESRKGRNSDAR
jgi:hypothetical protein